MTTTEVEAAPPALPDYLLDPNAVLKDAAEWRYGKAPDYSKTRTVYQQTKQFSHEASSLPSLVENLVKNWEIEASFKSQLSDWRTVDRANYSFAINGGLPQTAEYMLEVGTYNAIIAPNEFYSPAKSDFASSHKTFKRMMPTFAWEVMEVYSGPPKVAFRWRHWGEMKNDYVGFNDKGEKIIAKAHNGPIDIQGVTVALVDEKVRLQKVETWFDPLEMFRQIMPHGIVNKDVVEAPQPDDGKGQEERSKVPQSSDMISEESNANEIAKDQHDESEKSKLAVESVEFDASEKKEATPQTGANNAESFPPTSMGSDDIPVPLVTGKSSQPKDRAAITSSNTHKENQPTTDTEAIPELPQNAADPLPAIILPQSQGKTDLLGSLAEEDFPSRDISAIKTLEERINSLEARLSSVEVSQRPTSLDATALKPGSAVASAPGSEETTRSHEEMSRISAGECPFLMNRE